MDVVSKKNKIPLTAEEKAGRLDFQRQGSREMQQVVTNPIMLPAEPTDDVTALKKLMQQNSKDGDSSFMTVRLDNRSYSKEAQSLDDSLKVNLPI